MPASTPVTCPRPSAHCEDGLAVLPAGAVHARHRAFLLVSLAVAAGLAGDEDPGGGLPAGACRADRAPAVNSCAAGAPGTRLWALGLAAWRRGDLDRAAGLEQESLRLRQASTTRWALPCAWRRWPGSPRRDGATSAPRCCSAPPPGGGGRWARPWTAPSIGRAISGTAGAGPPGPRRAGVPGRLTRGLELPARDALAYALQQPTASHQGSRPKKPRGRPAPGGAPLTSPGTEVARLVPGAAATRRSPPRW